MKTLPNKKIDGVAFELQPTARIAEGGIFCVPSADTEADLFYIAEDNICCRLQFRHLDNWRWLAKLLLMLCNVRPAFGNTFVMCRFLFSMFLCCLVYYLNGIWNPSFLTPRVYNFLLVVIKSVLLHLPLPKHRLVTGLFGISISVSFSPFDEYTPILSPNAM